MTFDPRSITTRDLAYFRADISKDEHYRGLGRRGGRDVFVKQVRDRESARREFEALSLLAAAEGEPLVPRAHDVSGCELHLEVVEGIRLYDLLRLLRQVGEADAECRGAADGAVRLLLNRCRVRLERIQILLAAAAPVLSVGAYPFDAKVVRLLAMLSRLLGQGPLGNEVLAELDAAKQIWVDHVRLPFRDATPKNVIVAVESLAVGRHPDEAARQTALVRLLKEKGMSFWESAALFDVDFSSVEHLTSPEDDLVSLLAHEISFQPGSDVSVRGLPLMRALRLHPERSALTIFVRYLSFAGRKVMYGLINPRGGAMRFRHDRHGFYFQTMPRLVTTLHPTIQELMPATLARWDTLAEAAAHLEPDDGLVSDFYLESLGRPVRYWQESPLERTRSEPASRP